MSLPQYICRVTGYYYTGRSIHILYTSLSCVKTQRQIRRRVGDIWHIRAHSRGVVFTRFYSSKADVADVIS